MEALIIRQFFYITRARPGPGPVISQIEQWIAEADQYFSQGAFAEAEQSLRQVLSEQPQHRQALESLVIVCLQDGRREVALEDADLVISVVTGSER